MSNRPSIRPHHQRAIERLADAYRDDPRFDALIIGGSVAKGYARDDSDVDFLIVATDEEFRRRRAARDLFINRQDLTDYPGGYVDGKVIDRAFLDEVAERGNEPSRAAFQGAFAAFSREPDLDGQLGRIATYPAAGHDERVRAFFGMAFIQQWLMHEAQRHGDRYTIARAASQLALFAGRLILAHNRVLFPYHKWFRRALRDAPDKPERFVELVDALLSEPTSESANAVFGAVRNFREWGVSDLDAYSWFMTDVEWAWRDGRTPMEDW